MIWNAFLAAFLVLLFLAFFSSIHFLEVRKDGGPESKVTGYWLIELKWLFSIALLRFDPGSREVYHSHAFNCISWVFGPGRLREELLSGDVNHYKRSWRPVITLRSTFHRVFSEGTTWVLTFRGPWRDRWFEYDESTRATTELTHGRHVVWSDDTPVGLTAALAMS